MFLVGVGVDPEKTALDPELEVILCRPLLAGLALCPLLVGPPLPGDPLPAALLLGITGTQPVTPGGSAAQTLQDFLLRRAGHSGQVTAQALTVGLGFRPGHGLMVGFEGMTHEADGNRLGRRRDSCRRNGRGAGEEHGQGQPDNQQLVQIASQSHMSPPSILILPRRPKFKRSTASCSAKLPSQPVRQWSAGGQ